MTKRVMEQKANRQIDGNMPVQMSETHLEVLRSYGFQFGAKTGSRFIAAVHEIVVAVSQEKINEMRHEVNEVEARCAVLEEKLKAAQGENNKLIADSEQKTAYYKTLEAKIDELKLSADLLTAGTGRMAELVTKARDHAAAHPNDQQGKDLLYMCEAMVCAFNGEEPPVITAILNKEGLDQIAKTGALAADGSGIESTEIKPTAPAPMPEAEAVNEAINRG